MKVAILQCDDVLEKFQPEFGSYNHMIQHMFDEIDSSLEFESFDCKKGQFPVDIDVFDFFITTGSKSGVYEKKLWIQQLVEFVQQLDQHQKKLIGICFGHQIIAQARGCAVEKSIKGWGIGVAENRILTTPEWMGDTKKELNIIVSHQDQVTQIPEEALIIAESNFCPYFVVQWNSHFLSIQGHPEWNTSYSKALMNERRAIIPAERIEAGMKSLNIEPDNTLFSRWIINFVKNINAE